jgi:hypothetical protein
MNNGGLRRNFSRPEFVRELKEMGPERVRSELLRLSGRRWSPTQCSIARDWLDREDARQREETAADRPLDPRSRIKMSAAVILGVGILYVLVRLFNRLL